MNEGAFVTVAAPPVVDAPPPLVVAAPPVVAAAPPIVAAAPPVVAAPPTGKEEMRGTGFFATIIGGNDSSLDDSSSLNE